MSAQVVLRDILKVHVAPILRAHGYAGSGQDFHRPAAGNWAAINVQRSKWSTRTELAFTINVGTASTAARLEDGFRDDEPAREIDCHWRNRLGDRFPQHGPMPGGGDVWWKVRSRMSRVEQGAVGGQVGSVVVGALPAIDRMATDEAILASVLDGRSTDSNLAPAERDVVGPILRRLGPPERLQRYLAACDAVGPDAAKLYELFDDWDVRIGPARIQKALADLGRTNAWKRQEAIERLGYATATPEILRALRPFLTDENKFLRRAAAQALGRLADAEAAPPLQAMVREDPARDTAVIAAYALAKLDGTLDSAARRATRAAVSERHARAAGHDRAGLAELLRRLGA
jgi:hypothetical protein